MSAPADRQVPPSEAQAPVTVGAQAPVTVEAQTPEAPRAAPFRAGRPTRLIAALLPILLTAGLVAFFVRIGTAGIFPGNFPPLEDLTVSQVTLRPGLIKLVVTNGGPSAVSIAQVLIDDAYWQFTSSKPAPLARLASTTLTIPYPWVQGEPLNIVIVSSTGLTFKHNIKVAAESPSVDRRFLTTFALLGAYIGLVPVLLGMMWKPFMRGLSARWLSFFMALTAGVLVFLAVEALNDSLKQANALPTAFGGPGVVAAAAIGAFALILLGGRRFKGRPGANPRLVTAFTVAVGIGIHNMGEGLAVGAAYRLGEIALGAFLVIGFTIQNTTEGLGIVSILGDRKVSLMTLLTLGLIAGLPTIAGAWMGAFFFSPTLAAVFLAVALGAIAEVTYDVMGVVRRSEGGLLSLESLTGIATGLALMYLTGLLVAA